jgi:hypothetical protein
VNLRLAREFYQEIPILVNVNQAIQISGEKLEMECRKNP